MSPATWTHDHAAIVGRRPYFDGHQRTLWLVFVCPDCGDFWQERHRWTAEQAMRAY